MYSFIVILNNSLNLHDRDIHINKPVSCSQLQTFKPSSARLPPVFLTSPYKAPSFIYPHAIHLSHTKIYIHAENLYPSTFSQKYISITFSPNLQF